MNILGEIFRIRKTAFPVGIARRIRRFVRPCRPEHDRSALEGRACESFSILCLLVVLFHAGSVRAAIESSGSFVTMANARSIGTTQVFDAGDGGFVVPQSSENHRIAAGWVATLDLIGSPVEPTVNAPAPGATLPGNQLNLSWNPNRPGVTEWRVSIGRTKGGSDVTDSGSIGTNTTYTASGMPTDGGPLHVRLWFRTANGWEFEDVFYRASGPDAGPTISSPSPGSVLNGATLNLDWEPNGVTATDWRIYVGNSRGARDLGDSGNIANVSLGSVAGLPTDGRVIHVRLWWFQDGVWQHRDWQFAAATVGGPIAPAITSPVEGGAMESGVATFEWTANSTVVSSWWLRLGNRPGAADIFDSGALAGTTATVSGLPEDGRPIHARLWYLANGKWRYRDYRYSAVNQP